MAQVVMSAAHQDSYRMTPVPEIEDAVLSPASALRAYRSPPVPVTALPLAWGVTAVRNGYWTEWTTGGRMRPPV